jgi:hypothetical protein
MSVDRKMGELMSFFKEIKLLKKYMLWARCGGLHMQSQLVEGQNQGTHGPRSTWDKN